MINIKQTLASTIMEKILNLRMLAKNDPLAFKKILYLIIMDDIYDWADYKDDGQGIQLALQRMRYDFVRENTEFTIERDINTSFYRNVNTPQNNDTWKRVWDAPDILSITSDISAELPELPSSFTPDYSCDVELVYFPNPLLKMSADTEGYPIVDLNNLTTCQKMNIYINRENGQMFYLDEACLWQKISNELTEQISISQIKDMPTIYKGIKHTFKDSADGTKKVMQVELLTDGTTSSDIKVADDELNDF